MLEIEKISNEKAFLIGVVTGGLSPEVVEEHLDELELLTETAGAETVGRFTQRVNRISPKIFHRQRESRANCQSGQDARCKSDRI